ncbi:rhodanese-like domain-containing protein [Thiorhodovibrio frisius]|uniref:Rhodanese-related sulfurtransferase n=1 Tax=Thiorhodovibrio frisius TaxID=631362 RepID=H8Z4P3_9GAMM|nr:rhodanese-like domain-containing protein [Thiorhodovibrio frisius]EIC20300.1 Rhodanese-related sulfurtransferase [Thiorhodovibrio frisius]WPL21038.1 putative adenylyltransferase/sulfurtransferase MoeZ [Thiorhodovibrio frisius]
MQDISPTDLSERLATDQEPPLLLDVREPWETAICQIPGSHLLPMREIPERRAGLDANRETVVICHHGVRSLQVALYLERMGHRNIFNLQGGIAAWAKQVDPQMATY